jgi:hypothetical protein
MDKHINNIKELIEPLRQKVINHKVYSVLNNIDDLKIFMQYHIYAVWDFMSLLKTLQNKLTCTQAPWFPVGSADTRYLINEIVLGEESDIDNDGKRKSHFELYIDAMKQCGADVSKMETFIKTLQATGDIQLSFSESKTPKEAIEFVDFTFDSIKNQKIHVVSAIFTFGREDLIPEMFLSIIDKIPKKNPNETSILKYYIERHIEVDGNHHSNLALQMTNNLCNNNEIYWKEAELAIIESLNQRINLWDGVYNEIMKNKPKTNEI